MKKEKKWTYVFGDVKLNLAFLVILLFLIAVGQQVLRISLLRNSYNTGRALSHNYASEEQGYLDVYSSLLSFGVSTIDRLIEDGYSYEQMEEWMEIYFEQLQGILGEDTVAPYLIMGKKLISVQPLEEGTTYDFSGAEWYEKALEANGKVIITDSFIDRITGRRVVTLAQKCRTEGVMLAFDIFTGYFRLQFQPLDFNHGESFFLCDSKGTILYQQTRLKESEEDIQKYVLRVIKKIKEKELETYNSYIADPQGNRRAVYHTVMNNGWYALITVPYDNIYADLQWFTVLSLILAVVFVTALFGFTLKEIASKEKVERVNEVARMLGNSYYAVYRINYREETYEMIKVSDYIKGLLPDKGRYEELVEVLTQVISPDAREDYRQSFSVENIRRLVQRQESDFGGEFLRKFGDSYKWVSVRVLFDERFSEDEVILCYRDIEEERQGQTRERKLLEDALEVARKNEDMKQTFFNNMSHDMRTPLNAIMGLSELAESYAGDEEKIHEYLQKINHSSRQLLGLVNDILDMSRMEHGKVLLNNQQFNLCACTEECLEAFRLQAEVQKKTLRTRIDVEDDRILGDPFRISQVINNLLSNAFKFTSEGDCISLLLLQIDQGEIAKYKIVVSDTGIGMSEEFLPHLFEPYVRERRFTSRQVVGTGLGMPITKNLITQMNGEIQVDSKAGMGTTFTVILPFCVVPGREEEDLLAETEPQAPMKDKHLLLVEDNAINMEISTELLTMNGAKVTQAWNGKEAVDLIRQSKEFTFDAILMDMQMPVMDGCEAARRIRNLPDRLDTGRIPIIAVTANAFAEDISATTAAGMDAHISKPIDFKLLCKTLHELKI